MRELVPKSAVTAILAASLTAPSEPLEAASKPLLPEESDPVRNGAVVISPGECLQGELAPGDEQYIDGSYIDPFTLSWPGGGLQITLDSPDFNEFLFVLDPEGLLNQVDNSPTEPEVFRWPSAIPGTYSVLANSAMPDEGTYELCVSEPMATPTPTLTRTPTPCIPEPTPFGPQPADGVDEVSTEVELSWNRASKNKVIYGVDDRMDVYQVSDTGLLAAYNSTVILVDSGRIDDNGDGTWNLENEPWVTQGGMPLCLDEPFRGQPHPGFCSGFLVGPDLVVTAGHCIAGDLDCSGTVFVFGFQMLDANNPVLAVPEADVYFCAEIVDRVLDGETRADWALIRLDRPVAGREPLWVRRNGTIGDHQSLVMIGYPSGLPAKIAGGAFVRENSSAAYFTANTDSFGGNSGSVVLNAETLRVEGILVRGEIDFVDSGGCRSSKQCPNEGCRGEDITRITELSELIPILVRYEIYFGDCESLQLVGTTEDTNWTVSGLSEDATYCWRVDAVNDCSISQGPVWSFTTAIQAATPTATPLFPTATPDTSPTPTPMETPCEVTDADFDRDESGSVDANDLLDLIEALRKGEPNPELDFNCDGRIDMLDGFLMGSKWKLSISPSNTSSVQWNPNPGLK